MALSKKGSPVKISMVKQSGFSMDVNALTESFLKDWPTKKITIDQMHSGLKSIGVMNYSSEDFSELMGRLQAVGFSIQQQQ